MADERCGGDVVVVVERGGEDVVVVANGTEDEYEISWFFIFHFINLIPSQI